MIKSRHALSVKALMFPSRNSVVHIIKRKANPLTYSEFYFDCQRHYVIGFPNVILARKVQYTIAPEPSFRLYRRDFDDITEEVNAGLRALGVKEVDGCVTLDTRAMLHIPKQDDTLPDAMKDGMYHMNEVPIADFLMYPFENNLGIIMPYDITREDNNELVLMAHVVESTDSIEQFRKSLTRL